MLHEKMLTRDPTTTAQINNESNNDSNLALILSVNTVLRSVNFNVLHTIKHQASDIVCAAAQITTGRCRLVVCNILKCLGKDRCFPDY